MPRGQHDGLLFNSAPLRAKEKVVVIKIAGTVTSFSRRLREPDSSCKVASWDDSMFISNALCAHDLSSSVKYLLGSVKTHVFKECST